MLLIFVMVLCAWFWPNCPKALKENKKLLLGVFLGFFFTKFMGNIEGVENKRKRKGKRKKKKPPIPSPSPIPVLNNHLDDYCASLLTKGDSDFWWTMNKREKCMPQCMFKGELGDYLLPDDKIDQIDPEQVLEWQSKWRDMQLPDARHRADEYGTPVNITSYRKKGHPTIRDLCNPTPASLFQNIDKYLNREGQTLCLNCYEI